MNLSGEESTIGWEKTSDTFANESHLVLNSSISDVCDDECQDDVWTFWIEGIAVLAISVFGIFGNLLCLFVFNQKSVDLKPSFSNILKCLSIYDMALLTGVLILYTLPALSDFYNVNIKPYSLPIVLPLTQVALTGSVYSVVIVAMERYFNVCKPFHKNLGSICEGWGYISIIVVFSFAYNITKFMEFETVIEIDDSGNKHPVFKLTPLRQNHIYHTTWVVCNTIIMGLLPLSALTFLNWRIIASMNAATRFYINMNHPTSDNSFTQYARRHNSISSLKRRDRAMTGLLTGVVVVLVICHTPKMFINFHESYHILRYGKMSREPLWGKILIKFSHLLLTTSSAINILIYSYKDFKFRAALKTFCSSFSADRLSHEETVIDKEGVTTCTAITLQTQISMNGMNTINGSQSLITSL